MAAPSRFRLEQTKRERPHKCSCLVPMLASDADRLMPAAPEDLADALAFALRYSGRKRTHDAGEMMAAIVAKRLVEHLERFGFVVMKKPPIGGGAAIGRGYDGR